MTSNIISECAVFEGLLDSQIEDFLQHSKIVEFSKGVFIFHQGDIGTSMYIVLAGECDVIIESKTKKDLTTQKITTIKKGGFFGEICLLTTHKRTASVQAATNCKLLCITAKAFKKSIDKGDTTALRISYNISVIISEHLRKTNVLISDLLQRLANMTSESEILQYRKRFFSERAF